MSKHYFIPESGNFYKANLHCHSTYSDGKLTPEQIKEVYMAHGYSVVAYTDHELLHDNSHLTDDRFLALTGYEIAADLPLSDSGPYGERRCVHINLISPEPHRLRHVCFDPGFVGRWCDHDGIAPVAEYYGDIVRHSGTSEWVNQVVAEGREHGFLVTFNHPSWSCLDYGDYGDYEGFWGLELFNTGCDKAGNIDGANVYDHFLRRGKYMMPLATDDNHSGLASVDTPRGSMCGGWVVVRAERLDYDTVFAALQRGDFYASTGPEIQSLYAEDGVLHIACSPVRRILATSGGQACAQAYPSHFGETITGADITFATKGEDGAWQTGMKGYLRVTIEDAEGHQAWSKAIPLAELLDGSSAAQ